jgi:hypothetical protein
MITLYRVEFRPPGGGAFRLDTPDPAKVGPWIADMFGLFPWHPSWPDVPVRITTSEIRGA